MSIFKRLKEKVTSSRARISLRLDEDSTALGKDLIGALSIMSEEEFDAMEIRCESTAPKKPKRQKHTYDRKLGREIVEEVHETATLYSANTPNSS